MAKRRRRKTKFKRQKTGLKVTDNVIGLVCYECNLTKEIERTNEDVDQTLDREAIGWYTVIGGIALCPKHVIESGTDTTSLHLTERIYGDPEKHRRRLEAIMERTRRIKERASWKSATSDASTTSETC